LILPSYSPWDIAPACADPDQPSIDLALDGDLRRRQPSDTIGAFDKV